MRDKEVEMVLEQIKKKFGNSVSNGEITIEIIATMDTIGLKGKVDTDWRVLMKVGNETYRYDTSKKYSRENEKFIKVFRKIFQLD